MSAQPQRAPQAHWKRRFFTIWTGQAFSLLGSSLVDFSLIWWLTDATGSEQLLIISTLLKLLPQMILGPFTGVLIDRMNRKRVMLIADGSIALVTVGLLALVHTGQVTPGAVLAVLALRSLGGTLHQPAMRSATVLMIPGEQQARIAGMNRMMSGAMTVVTPVAGALMLELFGLESTLYVDIVTAAIAVGTLLPVSVPDAQAQGAARAGVLREAADGFRYVLRTGGLFFVVGTCTLVNIGVGPCQVLRPLLVKEVFGGGALELSWITAAGGVGLAAGGAIMSAWGGFKRNLLTSGLGWGGVGASLMAIALLPGDNFAWLVACTFVMDLFNAIGASGLEAYYAANVDERYHGRVFSVLTALDNTTVPLGLIAATFMTELVPMQFWFFLTGALHFMLFVFWSFSKRLKQCEIPRA